MSNKTHLIKTLLAEQIFQNGGLLQREKKISAVNVGYAPEDDIYARDKEMQDINPEDISSKKVPNVENDFPKEIGVFNRFGAEDLDVPGTELDDADEMIGAEDEENNYYSIAGDNYKELEEDHYD